MENKQEKSQEDMVKEAVEEAKKSAAETESAEAEAEETEETSEEAGSEEAKEDAEKKTGKKLFGKKKESLTVHDKIWITEKAKFEACINFKKENVNIFLIAWFEETKNNLEEYFKENDT